MEMRQIRYFLMLAEKLHFHQASDALNLSQPTLSLQIQQLEEEIGVKLFKRTSRHVELTRAGESLVTKLRDLLEGVDEAVGQAQRVSKGLEGALSIAYVSTAVAGVLPRAIKMLQTDSPNVDFDLDEFRPQEQIDRILNGRTDIGFMHAQLEHHQLVSKVVQRDKLLVALPGDSQEEGPVDLRKYKDSTVFMPRPWGAASFGFYSHVQRAFQLAGAMPGRVIHANIANSIRFVASGVGYAIVPSAFQATDVQGVIFRALLNPPPPVELVAVWNKNSKSKILERFIGIFDNIYTA